MQRTLTDFFTETKLTKHSVVMIDDDSNSVHVIADDFPPQRSPTRVPNAHRRSRFPSPGKEGTTGSTAQRRRTDSAAEVFPADPSSPATGSASALPCSSRWLLQLITDPAWRVFLQPLTADSWRDKQFTRIEEYLDAQQSVTVLPPRPDIFSAFAATPLDQLKVVLLGQDPYHDIGQAHGLCFSVRPGVRPPPSLQNMYKELAADIDGFRIPSHGCLHPWATQGMLLLNATLTVEAHKPNSHKDSGWQYFTDDTIRLLSARHPNRLVFLLWGNFARKKRALIDGTRHVVIESAHPSPLSARLWFGCKCFSACNAALEKLGHRPLDWQLPLTVPPM